MHIQTKKALQYAAVITGLCCIIIAIGLPIYLTWFENKEPKACPYLATPVTFQSVELKKIGSFRTQSVVPLVTFSYFFQGKEHTSKSVFCVVSDSLRVESGRVRDFAKAAQNAEPIVAWVKPEKPDSGCISINSEFGYSTLNNISKQCLAK